jgi:NAD(P)-dependent dehydrogenase (short-subunit alcohol dehydrogenase family)
VNKTAIITGASRGLGFALAQALAQKHWNLVINARGKEALGTARTELAQHTQVMAIAGDISDEDHAQEIIAAAREFGGLDLLVNNASILGPMTNLEDIAINELEHVYKINTFAPLRLIQLAVPIFKPNARVIKAALEQLSRVLANEHPDWKIYWVDPGDMRTQMHQEAFPGEDISGRPTPEISVPGILKLIEANLPSGRYKAQTMLEVRR